MITNGTVKFNRRVRTGDFEHKDASVELTFSNQGEAVSVGQIEVIAALAVEKALGMVGERAAPPVAVPADPMAGAAASTPVVPAGSTIVDPMTGAAPTPTSPVLSPSEIVIGAPAAPSPVNGASTSTAGAEPITDAQLVNAITSKNASLLAKTPEAERGLVPVRLGEVVARFDKTVPPNVRKIPAELRAEFLRALDAL